MCAVIRGVQVAPSTSDALERMAAAQHDIAAHLDTLLARPASAGYQDIMRSIGFPGTVHAGAKLAKLVAKRGLRPISNVVDTYNLAAARRALPIGAHDVDTIAWPLTLRIAGNDLSIKTFGTEMPVVVRPGSIVFADAAGATIACIGKNDVDCIEHAVGPATRCVLFTMILHKQFPSAHAQETLLSIFEDLKAIMPNIDMDFLAPSWASAD